MMPHFGHLAAFIQFGTLRMEARLQDFDPQAQLRPGDTAVILGLRGSGKSTLALHLRRLLLSANILPDTLSIDKAIVQHFCANTRRVNIVETQLLQCIGRETPIDFIFFLGLPVDYCGSSVLQGLQNRLSSEFTEETLTALRVLTRRCNPYEAIVISVRGHEFYTYKWGVESGTDSRPEPVSVAAAAPAPEPKTASTGQNIILGALLVASLAFFTSFLIRQ